MAKVINYADDMPNGSLKKELKELYRKRNYYLDTMGAEKVLGVLGAILSTESDVKKGESEMKIFISHSSKDKVFGDILLGLLKGLGLGRNEIIYTSNDLYGIPLGKKIYSYLRDNIDTNVHILFLLSDNYFDSVACLNEMGATWLAQKEYTIIGAPNFDFNGQKFNDSCIDSKEMGMHMNSYVRLAELKEIIESEFGKRIDNIEWQSVLEKYKQELEKV